MDTKLNYLSSLNLSPEAYIFLVSNGIKSISFLRDFTSKELFLLKMPGNSLFFKEDKRLIIEEIMEKLKAFEEEHPECFDFPRLAYEVKISELSLEGRGEYRLQTNGIYTVGKLSTLSKSNILNMHAIGNKTLNGILMGLDSVFGFSFGLSQDEMVCLELPEEEREYYFSQLGLFQEINAKRREKMYLEEENTKLNATNRNTIYQFSIRSLGIPDPIFVGDTTGMDAAKMKLGELLGFLSYRKVMNASEVAMGLRRLKVPGLYFGMTRKEVYELAVSNGVVDELKAFMRNVAVKQEEEAFMRAQLLDEDTSRRYTHLQEQMRCHNEFLKSQVQVKEELFKKLSLLADENEKLREVNSQLDTKIAELSHKLGFDSKTDGDGSYGK